MKRPLANTDIPRIPGGPYAAIIWRCAAALLAAGSALVLTTSVLAQEPGAAGTDPLSAAQESFEHPVKYAIYSPAWHLSTNAGLRLVAQNQSDDPVELRKIVFTDEAKEKPDMELELSLTIPPHGWAEKQVSFQDLLSGSDCVERTMQDDWRLVEISNYTLNPSVRGLIIEDTRSFRIYQCVRSVHVYWYDPARQEQHDGFQWLMYHFERLPLE